MDRLASLTEELQRARKVIRTFHQRDAAVEELTTRHEKEIDHLERKHEKSLEKLEKRHEKELEKLTSRQEQEIEELEVRQEEETDETLSRFSIDEPSAMVVGEAGEAGRV